MIIEGNVRNKLLVIGIVFLILGFIFFLGWYRLETTYSRARRNSLYLRRSPPVSVIKADLEKVRNLAIAIKLATATIGSIFFIGGLTLTATALLKDRNKKGKQDKKTAYNMNQIMEDELSAIVSRETKKNVAIQEEVISNIHEIETLRQLLFEKGIITEDEFINKFKKLDREMKEKKGR